MAITALGYALTFGALEPADFTMINGTEIKSLDPAIVSGAPEGRIINALFEGLFRQDPQTVEPIPAICERHEISEDGRTYRFHLRKACQWSDGTPITAHDFVWSWRRFLMPETPAEYAYQLFYIPGAKKFNSGVLEVGDRVEVELANRPNPRQTFPQGTLLRGTLRRITKPPEPQAADGIGEDEQATRRAHWQRRWIYEVEIEGQVRRFRDAKAELSAGDETSAQIEPCQQVLYDFAEVGIQAENDRLLQVTLKEPTPYFLYLMAFYPLYPVNRACVERHGREWMQPENLVTSGPYRLEFRRIRDRIRLRKNPNYWNADQVQLEVIDALAVNSSTTSLNMYMNGEVDWALDPPATVMSELIQRDDLLRAPMLTTYFYRINTTRPGLRDVRVRRALNLAINKQEICDQILGAGQLPARGFVPPGVAGYQGALCGAYDPQAARALLAEAGFSDGHRLPTIELLYNDTEGHRKIAEKIQNDWQKNLGVQAQLRGMEWGVFLDTTDRMQYSVARAGWIGDYPDPNTFLDMFVTDGENNETGWSNARYDEIIQTLAPAEKDPSKRLALLREAEQLLMDQQPIIPIYFYVSLNLVRPYVEGFYPNIQDIHPLHRLRIVPDLRRNHRRSFLRR